VTYFFFLIPLHVLFHKFISSFFPPDHYGFPPFPFLDVPQRMKTSFLPRFFTRAQYLAIFSLPFFFFNPVSLDFYSFKNCLSLFALIINCSPAPSSLNPWLVNPKPFFLLPLLRVEILPDCRVSLQSVPPLFGSFLFFFFLPFFFLVLEWCRKIFTHQPT